MKASWKRGLASPSIGLVGWVFVISCGQREFIPNDEGRGGQGGGAGAPSGGASSDELSIEGELPRASFNRPYEARLEAAGEQGEVTFELVEGQLPNGLTLDADGSLAGKPTEAGTFEFVVSVTDETDESASRDFALRVVRKPWLVVSSDEETLGQQLLYAIDTSKSLYPKTLLGPEVQADGDVTSYAFSADGDRLGFLVDDVDDDVKRLFVVDFTRAEPGESRLIEADGSVESFVLSPDGTKIAFRVATSDTTSEIRYAAIVDGEPSESISVSDTEVPANRPMTWVGNQHLVYSDVDYHFVRILNEEGEFGAARQLNYGLYEHVDHAKLRLVLTNSVTSCARRAWLFDFANDGELVMAPAVEDSYAWPTYDPTLTRVAHPNPNDQNGIFVFDALDTAGEPLGLVSPTNTCDRVYWAPDGSRVVIPNDDGRYTVSTIGDGSFETSLVAGDYGYSDKAYFLDRDRFVFTAGDTAFQVFADAEEPEASALHEPLAEGDSFAYSSAAPDGSWVALYAALETAGNAEPFAIDLREREPGPLRPLSDSATYTLENGFIWSPDASRLAFVVRGSSGTPALEHLMLVDLLHDTALGTQVTQGTCHAGTPTACETLGPAVFQP